MPRRRRLLAGFGAALAWGALPAGIRSGASGAAARAPGAPGEDRPAVPAPRDAPRARVLGIAQDGGLPHLGCRRSCCVTARSGTSRARRVACLGVGGGAGGGVFLVDATPDLPAQAAEMSAAAGAPERPGRPVDAILLTHAHVGHYAGLIHLGREAAAARDLPVVASPRMCAFLKANRPWSRLVEWGHVRLEPLDPGASRALAPGLEVASIPVPHRDEDSDTVAYLFSGPRRRLLYLPDTDGWGRWRRSVRDLLSEADVALVDGTFFGPGEVPGRDLSEIPHPLISTSLEHLGPLAAPGRRRILFTHLNHSNPALDPASEAAREIARNGLEVAEEGMEFAL